MQPNEPNEKIIPNYEITIIVVFTVIVISAVAFGIFSISKTASNLSGKKETESEKPLAENELFKPSDSKPYERIPFNRICQIVTIKDGRGNTHEYLDYWVGNGNGGGSICHYPDCKYCLEKNNDKH